MQIRSENTISCCLCGSKSITLLIELPHIPVQCNFLCYTRDEASHVCLADMKLVYCHDCGYIFNPEFNPGLIPYNQNYEVTLDFSPRFQNYISTTCSHLIERYSLHKKNIIDIGCGQGYFLKALCEQGNNKGIGFDPGFISQEIKGIQAQQIRFIQDFYSEQYAHYDADFICCRHVLEHVHKPADFMRMVRRTLCDTSKTHIYFEVPNAEYMIANYMIWDIIYEHCSYFTRSALGELFASCGFHVTRISEGFGNQYLCVEAQSSVYAKQSEKNLTMSDSEVKLFADTCRSKIERCKIKLQDLFMKNKKVVLWGAGSKGVMLLNMLNVKDQIDYVVDINPRKHDTYIPGTAQKIVAKEFLAEYQPDVVLITNPLYQKEMYASLAVMGCTAEIIII